MVVLKIQLSPQQLELVRLFSWIIALTAVIIILLKVFLRSKSESLVKESLEENSEILELVNSFTNEFREGVKDRVGVLRSYLNYRAILLEYLNYNPPIYLTEREVMDNVARRAESIGFKGDSIRNAYLIYERARFGSEKLSKEELETYWKSIMKVIKHVRARVSKIS